MRKPDRLGTWARLARRILPGAGVLLLAGCATGYSFVQPDMAGSGSYYTGDGPYTGQGYYDYYATGPYYPGTSGWGYYNGTDPDPDKPRPWLKPDHAPVPPRIAHDSGSAPSVALPVRRSIQRPVEGFANRRPLESTAFAPHDFVRGPVRRSIETGIGAVPSRRAWVPPRPNESAFAFRREMRIPQAVPRESHPVVQPAFRPRTPPPARVAAPPPRRDQRIETKIP